MATTNQHSKLLVCAIGIFVCYFYFGMLQEKITRGQYGDGENREKFTYMFALVFVQCLVNYLFAKTILLTVLKQGEDTTSTLYYALSALTYLLAMVCSNMALQFVSYPTQVIGKAGKPIPVMILGVLLGRKVHDSFGRSSIRIFALSYFSVTSCVTFHDSFYNFQSLYYNLYCKRYSRWNLLLIIVFLLAGISD